MVQVGMLLSDVPQSVTPKQQFKDILRIVDAAQEAGMTTIAIGQHFLYGDLRWLQPVPLLARLAAHVEPHVRLATQVMVGPMYHPVMLAEEIATLDIVTEGRFTFGVGVGYREDEFDALGVPFNERGKRLDELLEVMKRLWTEDEVTHDGRFWQLDGVKPHIRPVQDPHPPIWIGAHAAAGARRAGRLADGFLSPPAMTLPVVAERLAVTAEGFAGRDKAFGPQPIRRNTWIADTDAQAAQEYAAVAQGRYLTYSKRGLDSIYDSEGLQQDFLETVADHAVIGSHETVAARLTEMARSLPLDPILVKPFWPTMDADSAIAQIRAHGEVVIPALNATAPATTIEPTTGPASA